MLEEEDEDEFDDDGGFKSIYGFVGLTAEIKALSTDSNCTCEIEKAHLQK